MKYEYRYSDEARVLYDALTDDAFYRTLESSASRDPARARRAMLCYLDYSMIEAEEHGQLCFPQERLAGAALWSLPLDAQLQETVSAQKKAFIEQYMGARCLEDYNAITAFMHEHTMQVVDPDSWYLSIIGIAPGSQGRGIGRVLVTSVLDKTDQAGIPTFLETFVPRNLTFYRRLGYVERGRFREPVTGTEYAAMFRDAVALR